MDLTGAVWRKSSYSGPNGGNCVEVAGVTGAVVLRDSQGDDDEAVIVLTTEQWRALTGRLRNVHTS
ncbi:DUF397 domain-containing protein [Spirillospora sp. NPDC047279]|uniref:DUF397 domain-containing protein n=1 Tax=Spirillospora sp. NPDC047279 TaxID=3155478 RepID=UPI0033E1133E